MCSFAVKSIKRFSWHSRKVSNTREIEVICVRRCAWYAKITRISGVYSGCTKLSHCSSLYVKEKTGHVTVVVIMLMISSSMEMTSTSLKGRMMELFLCITPSESLKL